MKNILEKIFSGGITIFYGVFAAVGAIALIICNLIMLYKNLVGNGGYALWMFGMAVFLAIILGFVAYVLIRIGTGEMENENSKH